MLRKLVATGAWIGCDEINVCWPNCAGKWIWIHSNSNKCCIRFYSGQRDNNNSMVRVHSRRLLAKLVPTFMNRGCHMFTVADPYCHILDLRLGNTFLNTSFLFLIVNEFLFSSIGLIFFWGGGCTCLVPCQSDTHSTHLTLQEVLPAVTVQLLCLLGLHSSELAVSFAETHHKLPVPWWALSQAITKPSNNSLWLLIDITATHSAP
jgi:hypothetical protein